MTALRPVAVCLAALDTCIHCPLSRFRFWAFFSAPFYPYRFHPMYMVPVSGQTPAIVTTSIPVAVDAAFVVLICFYIAFRDEVLLGRLGMAALVGKQEHGQKAIALFSQGYRSFIDKLLIISPVPIPV
ncbi:hypothetical protein DL89DRAFT_27925 [Linderina pennispora]|uniref:Uncharacterized protein n=1 Tax=Linderina pennispora TaxID=61395 RepID=A0A1Y1W409_9FUNG|nr:uncharacterized protein DL89DRAFT_27925 [Linderina pennispora]ORX68197.1 hypothetical protein DL89DRAFT_27925 [Linderina pennispora]